MSPGRENTLSICVTFFSLSLNRFSSPKTMNSYACHDKWTYPSFCISNNAVR